MQQYYTNKTDEKSYDVMICSIYDKGIYILPRQKVCTEYCVPFNHVHAKRFMNTFTPLVLALPQGVGSRAKQAAS